MEPRSANAAPGSIQSVGGLHAAAIPALLLAFVVYAFITGLSIRVAGTCKRVLLVGGPVTDALLRAAAIGLAGTRFRRTDALVALFVLPRCSARLTGVYE